MKLSVSNQFQSNTSKPKAISYCFNHHKFHIFLAATMRRQHYFESKCRNNWLTMTSLFAAMSKPYISLLRETYSRYIVRSRHKYKNIAQFISGSKKNAILRVFCTSTHIMYTNQLLLVVAITVKLTLVKNNVPHNLKLFTYIFVYNLVFCGMVYILHPLHDYEIISIKDQHLFDLFS